MAEEEQIEQPPTEGKPKIFALRTTANREDQVMDFVSSNAARKKMGVYSVIRAHGMRSYIFVEAATRAEAEQAAFNVPYARGILPKEIDYSEIEHMLETVKVEMNIQKNDIVEIISGPFKREQAKVSRIDKAKEEVVLELLEAAVPIPITVKLDSVKVIRRDTEEDEDEEEKEKELPIPGLIKGTENKQVKKEFVDDHVEKKEAEESSEEEIPVISSGIKIKVKKKKSKEPAEEIEKEIEKEEVLDFDDDKVDLDLEPAEDLIIEPEEEEGKKKEE